MTYNKRLNLFPFANGPDFLPPLSEDLQYLMLISNSSNTNPTPPISCTLLTNKDAHRLISEQNQRLKLALTHIAEASTTNQAAKFIFPTLTLQYSNNRTTQAEEYKQLNQKRTSHTDITRNGLPSNQPQPTKDFMTNEGKNDASTSTIRMYSISKHQVNLLSVHKRKNG